MGRAGSARLHVAFVEQLSGLIGCGEEERIATGEFEMFAVDCGREYYKWKVRGANVDQVVPVDAGRITHWYVGVPRNALHPNAAKLWINYLLSREAQDILYDMEYTDHHLVPGSKRAVEIEQVKARGAKLVEVDVEFSQRYETQVMGSLRNELARMIRR